MNHPTIPAISGETKLAGVIGWPIRHTLSPAMQNAAFAHAKMSVAYVPLGVAPEGLKTLLQTLRQLGALGVNVTIPYKEKVIPYLDQLSADAKAIGAVNTIVFQGGKLIGHNTDGLGFLASVKDEISLAGKRAVLVGTGGGGRAVAASLVRAQVHTLTVADIDAKKADQLARNVARLGKSRIQKVAPGTDALKEALVQADLLVNATPLGLKKGDPLPVNPAWLPKGKCVMDLVYGKRPTPLMQAAKRKQNVVVPGWRMLLLQGAESFRLWTGKKAPVQVMEAALLQAAGIQK